MYKKDNLFYCDSSWKNYKKQAWKCKKLDITNNILYSIIKRISIIYRLFEMNEHKKKKRMQIRDNFKTYNNTDTENSYYI